MPDTIAVAPRRSRRANTGGQHSQRLWAMFAAPGVVWLLAFFVVAFYAVMAVAFGSVDPILRTARPSWNPLQWDTHTFRDVVQRVATGDLRTVFVRTFLFVAAALAGCIAIGYPIAYFVARRAGRRRGLVLGLLVLPFWISYLMRMLAWTNLLEPDGLVNRVLHTLHLQQQPRNWLDGSWPTVVIGLVYGYVPFFILPLYSSLERIDNRLIEAGRDLGASGRRTFLAVTLPLSMPGLLAASVITVLPMFGDYFTNTYLTGGSTRTEMIGNQIEHYLMGTTQPQTGASLVLVLMVFLLVLMAYYLFTIVRQQRLADR